MKKIGFISDFYKEDLLGGGEINDDNLINHLQGFYSVEKYHSKKVKIEDLVELESIIVANFTLLDPSVVKFLINEKKYFIYEHDHKYVNTRDPSKFKNFHIPESRIVNKSFYENATCVVVLSKICQEVLNNTIPKATVHNIGCSIWSEKTFDFLTENSINEKKHDICIMKNMNPTKNYFRTVEFCKKRQLNYGEIEPSQQLDFLKQMSEYKKLLFIPTVLETFSRLCAEAKMLNLDVMTNKSMIGFFSEEYSSLKGKSLIEQMRSKNKDALKFFKELI